ncbi:MAG: aldose 1-epimerase family protein [Syntrophobacterales bacterium]|nr:MAG: aldose 1-epimerase family protein [Syntrophobacterales bacterium]
MARLFGQEFIRSDLLQRVGDISQLCGVRLMRLEDGSEEGVRVIEARTGTGFRFNVLASRGMDISFAEYKGIPLSWRSCTGDVSPAFYEPEGDEWHRIFYGGMVITCGLSNVGAPCEDQGERLGRHGRISATPAQCVYADGRWEEDEYNLVIQGRMKQATFWGENLSLIRKISTQLGTSMLRIEDEVENLDFSPTPLMFLYHVNLGFPILSEGSTLLIPTKEVVPMEASMDPKTFDQFHPPMAEASSQVFYHDMASDPEGRVLVALINERLSIGVYIQYNKNHLKNFVQWKMLGQGAYVLAIEPANCHVEGRALERERGTLEFLQPGEKKNFSLELGVLESTPELREVKEKIESLIREGS